MGRDHDELEMTGPISEEINPNLNYTMLEFAMENFRKPTRRGGFQNYSWKLLEIQIQWR